MDKRRRPFGVTMIALFEMLSTLVILIDLGFVADVANRGSLETLDVKSTYIATSLILVLFRPLTAVGLWWLRPWGWTFAMIFTGLLLASDLLAYANGEPQYMSMVINLIIVFYLNQRDVQRAFIVETANEQQ